jgi:hypothetical protein
MTTVTTGLAERESNGNCHCTRRDFMQSIANILQILIFAWQLWWNLCFHYNISYRDLDDSELGTCSDRSDLAHVIIALTVM